MALISLGMLGGAEAWSSRKPHLTLHNQNRHYWQVFGVPFFDEFKSQLVPQSNRPEALAIVMDKRAGAAVYSPRRPARSLQPASSDRGE